MANSPAKGRGNTTGQLSLTERLQANYAQAVCWAEGFAWGADIPRRLGGGADRAALAQDKKVMRQLAHLYRTMVGMWMRKFQGLSEVEPGTLSKEAQKFGAQVLPEQWIPQRIKEIETLRDAVLAATAEDPTYSRQITNRLAHEAKELLRVSPAAEVAVRSGAD